MPRPNPATTGPIRAALPRPQTQAPKAKPTTHDAPKAKPKRNTNPRINTTHG